ncbi:MAG TPA: DctP family TRAP transporter solute-binding subunit [Desulfosporosinus sp.]|nr:DctP family TRAP transporter solute-binding subunit [Desulfosporosinus sp.]
MGKKKLFVIFLALLLLGGCSPRVIDEQQVGKNEKIVIKFSHVVSENTPKGLAAKRFADLVRERTGGYVEVQVFPDSTLYKDGEEFEALKSGAVQMLAPATSKLSTRFPDWQLFDLPYAFPDMTTAHTLMDGPLVQELFTDLLGQKLLGLAMWDSGFKQFTNNIRPLRKPEDFQGLHFRIMTSQVLKEQFAELGAQVSPMPFNDVYQALKNGTVDAEENTISNIFTQHFDHNQKYLTLSNHGYLGYVVLTNAEFWKSLPPQISEILEDTLREVTIWEREKAGEMDQKQLVELEQEGKMEITHLTQGEQLQLQKALNPVYDHLSEEIGPDLVNNVKKIQQKGE